MANIRFFVVSAAVAGNVSVDTVEWEAFLFLAAGYIERNEIDTTHALH